MSKIPLDENQITKSKKDNSYDLKIIELNEEIKKLNIENDIDAKKVIVLSLSNSIHQRNETTSLVT